MLLLLLLLLFLSVHMVSLRKEKTTYSQGSTNAIFCGIEFKLAPVKSEKRK